MLNNRDRLNMYPTTRNERRRKVMRTIGLGAILIIIAAIVFILAAFGVAIGTVPLIPIGLALFALGHVLA